MKKLHGLWIWCCLTLFVYCLHAREIPSPEQTFGFAMGSDRRLIDWNQVVDYFLMLDAHSERIIVEERGRTTLDKPFLLAIISSSDNIAQMDRCQSIQQRIAHPNDLPQEEASALIRDGKAVVLLSLNIHSTEIGSSQESVELAYELATRTDEQTKEGE